MALSTRNVVTAANSANKTASFTHTGAYTVGAGTELLAVAFELHGGLGSLDVSVDAVRWEDGSGLNPEPMQQVVVHDSGAVGAAAGAGRAIIGWWVLPNPTARVGKISVDVTRNAGTIRSYSWTAEEVIGGVDTASPTGATNAASGESATAALSLTSTVANSLLLSADLHRYAGVSVTPFAPDAGVTELTEGSTGATSTSDHGYWAGERLAATPGAYAMGVTASASDIYAIAAIEIKPAATGISGSLAVTQDDNTLSATGSLLISGTASLTQADNTLAATGSLAITGSANISQADNTLASAGILSIAGIAFINQADNTLIATMTGAIGNAPGYASLSSQGAALSIKSSAANVSLGNSGASITIN